jgi:hypothetical protein
MRGDDQALDLELASVDLRPDRAAGERHTIAADLDGGLLCDLAPQLRSEELVVDAQERRDIVHRDAPPAHQRGCRKPHERGDAARVVLIDGLLQLADERGHGG